jgi:diaminohydroxyphosphoribosylaminopyrimidine deaminase / 5-amino-6-(5-phosphoribosylamino)uracil reductase
MEHSEAVIPFRLPTDMEPHERAIFAPFREASPDRPFVAAQLGQSLDGRIATASGESRGISGEAGLDHLHRLRAHVDVVVVGAGTILADDPQLTVRRVAGRNPARAVIDPSGKIDGAGRWLAQDGARRLRVTASERPAAAAGVENIRLETRDGALSPPAIVDALFARGLRRILIEGGARTIAAFIESGCLDRLHVLVSPVIIGSGRAGLDLAPIQGLDRALRPRTEVHVLGGGDVLFDCDFSSLRAPSS